MFMPYVTKKGKVWESIVKNLKFLGQDGEVLTAGKSGKIPPGQLNDVASTGSGQNEKFLYFYHPDHVGSTSYITDASGEVYQHLEYFAFGETFVEEHSNTNRTPYLFNGKELDDETGLYYYGARYYDPVTSVWLSVDPLADKYPNWSSYVYVFNNPINYMDPTGMEGEPIVSTKENKRNLLSESRQKVREYSGVNKSNIRSMEREKRSHIRSNYKKYGNSGEGNLLDFKSYNTTENSFSLNNKSSATGIENKLEGHNGGGVSSDERQSTVLLSDNDEGGNMLYRELGSDNMTSFGSFNVEQGGEISELWISSMSGESGAVVLSDQGGNVLLTVSPRSGAGIGSLETPYIIPAGVTAVDATVTLGGVGSGLQFRIKMVYTAPKNSSGSSKIRTYSIK